MSGKYKAQKPCKHCASDSQLPLQGSPHEFVLHNGALFYYDSDFGWEGINVNFCPFCGRMLSDNCKIAEDKMEGFV